MVIPNWQIPLLELNASWETEAGPIDAELLDWADTVLDRQGVDR